MRLLVPSAVLAAAAGSGFFVFSMLEWPRALAVAGAVAAAVQLFFAGARNLRRPLLQRLGIEIRFHSFVLQGLRGALLSAGAAAVSHNFGVITATFYATLILATSLLPRLVTRLAGARMLVAALPGASEMQDRLAVFDTVSQRGRDLRASIRNWVERIELVTAILVCCGVFGVDRDAVGSAVIAVTAIAALEIVLEASTLVISLLGRVHHRFHEQVVESMSAYAPEYLLYFSASTSAVYQVRQWLPHLLSLDRRFVVITRENGLVPRIAELAPGLPVVASPRLTLLDGLVVGSAHAVVYVNNGMRNAHMLRHTHLRHIQLLHGESDKAPSVNKFARAYDELYVAGQCAIDRYESFGVAVDQRAIRIVGRPQADAVSTSAPAGRPTILYAPTWEGYSNIRSESSVGVLGVELVRRLLARGDVRVIVRPHPTTGLASRWLLKEVETMRALIEEAGGEHVWSAPDGELSLVDCFNLCHVMIADISSVMADFLRSEKPLVVTDVDGLGAEGVHSSFPTTAASWVLEPEAVNIGVILDDVLGPDILREQRIKTRHYVLGDFDGPAEEVFHRTLATSVDTPLRPLPTGVDEVVDESSTEENEA